QRLEGPGPIDGPPARQLAAGASRFRERGFEPVQAQVVVAALQQRDLDRPADDAAEQRQVPGVQLVLQRARAGGDDGLAARQQRRREIRERLADAGAGLDRNVLPVLHRGTDDFRHLPLRVAIGEIPAPPRQRPVSTEQLGKPLHGGTITEFDAPPAAPKRTAASRFSAARWRPDVSCPRQSDEGQTIRFTAFLRSPRYTFMTNDPLERFKVIMT